MSNFVSALAAAGALVVMPLAAQAHSVQYGTAANWSLFRNSEGGQAYTGMTGMWTNESCNIGYGMAGRNSASRPIRC